MTRLIANVLVLGCVGLVAACEPEKTSTPDAGGGSGGTAGSLGQGGQGGRGNATVVEPMGLDEATERISAWAYGDSPNMGPGVQFDVVEYQVPGLWETMQVQLYRADYRSAEDGQWFRSESFVSYRGELRSLSHGLPGYRLLSAVLRGDSLYFSNVEGSGLQRSVIGRIAIIGGEFAIITSGGFAAVELFVWLADDELRIDEGIPIDFYRFNEWEGEPYGTLLEESGELIVYDESGAEIVPGFPRF
jgi:hypothetical protein